MADRLFVYGTLLAPELRRALIGRNPETTTATLAGYACFRVRRAPYPAVVAQPGASTGGEVLLGLTSTELDQLDEFESTLYQRMVTTVLTEDGLPLEAFAYVIDDGARQRLTDEAWDYELFRSKHLHRYLGAM